MGGFSSSGFGSAGGGGTVTDVAGLLDLKGSTDASANPNYPSASKADMYVITVAGKVGGASGKAVEVGDMLLALADNAGGTEASVGTSWVVLQANLIGALLAANNLSDLESAATARTNLGLAIGSNVAAYNANAVFLNVATAFSAQQNFAAGSITSTAASIAWDLATKQSAVHTFTENTTLANPSNMVNGGTYVLKLIQHASSPKTLAFGSAYKWPGGSAFVVSATNSAIDVLSFVSDGTYMFGVGQKAFA
jgi:hypothetical protein